MSETTISESTSNVSAVLKNTSMIQNTRQVGVPGVLDSDVRAYLERASSLRLQSLKEIAPADARRAYSAASPSVTPPPPEMAAVRNFTIPGPHGEIGLRLYRPVKSQESDLLPTLIYIHGGGWTIGDLDSHDVLCRQLANFTPCAVLSVDYRLAPENRFPIPSDDCMAATRWLFANAETCGSDPNRIAIGGDSAGANLAAVIALQIRDANLNAKTTDQPQLKLALQVLIYPATNQNCDTASQYKFADGYALTRDMILYFRDNYLSEDDRRQWQASPLFAGDLSNLPPALVITAGFDPLVDEGIEYAKRIAEAGNEVQSTCYAEMIHGFIRLGGVIPNAQAAVKECARELARFF